MPKRQTIKIDNVLGGASETQYNGSSSSFNIGLGIDPDFALSDPDSSGAITTGVRTSGLIVPTRYEKFSSASVIGYPTFLISNPKDTNIYVIANSAQVFSYSSSLGSETVLDSGGIAFDVLSSGSFSATTTKTVAHTPVSVVNGIAITDISFQGTAVTGVSVTYNGVAMTQVGTATVSNVTTYMFSLTAPPSGAQNVIASWTGSQSGWMHTRTYTGVDQSTPKGTPVTATGTSTTPSVTATSAVGELVVDVTTANAALTIGAGQTSRYIETTVVATGGSEEAGAASVVMSWSQASAAWASVAVPLKPAATSTVFGNGAAYYNNYIYIATSTNVDRYGPLNNSPSLTNSVWTGATLGSQPALIATTYPTVAGVPVPSHPMHLHGDNKLYIGDYNTTANPGKGVVHYIATTKTTNEGDTNNTSVANKLVLPFNFLPTDIESYGTDLVISAVQSTSSTINQGKAALFFWDTTALNFYRGPVYSKDPLITALKSVNGELYVWSGNSTRGCRLSKYIGGESLQEIMFIEDTPPPLSGAVESWGNRVAWGGSTSYPVTRGVVYSYGSKDQRLGNPLSIPIISTAGATTPYVTSILNYSHLSFVRPKLILGWGNGTTYGLDKLSTTATYDSVWRSELITIDNNFSNKRIRIPLSAPVAANMSIVPKLYIDNFQTTITLPTISTTLYSGQKKILYQSLELTTLGVMGSENILLELNFAGTAEIAVGLPILIDIEENDDENSV